MNNYYLEKINYETITITSLIIAILLIVAMWVIFQKAGESGIKSLIPIYNIYTLFKITWGSGWYFLLLCIPCINVIIEFVTLYKLSKSFGHGILFFLGLLFFPNIFTLILAFGSSKYYGY